MALPPLQETVALAVVDAELQSHALSAVLVRIDARHMKKPFSIKAQWQQQHKGWKSDSVRAFEDIFTKRLRGKKNKSLPLFLRTLNPKGCICDI